MVDGAGRPAPSPGTWPRAPRRSWPDQYARPGQAAASTEWRPLLFGDADFEDRHEWIDPAAEHWADVTPWTAQVRRQLSDAVAGVNGILDRLDEHPWQR
ncbi:hypothetical protein ABT061_16305 [Streptosporangium sp. NPDC002544]|uniref:hypothetical protein n=1 Tax=Streptosporangium sp. NPDC002544 TaxID=3154538 RepID=UPI003322054C